MRLATAAALAALTAACSGSGCSTIERDFQTVEQKAVELIESAEAVLPICLNSVEKSIVHTVHGDVAHDVLAGLDEVNKLAGAECPDGPNAEAADPTPPAK